jgi:hypothetical protein
MPATAWQADGRTSPRVEDGATARRGGQADGRTIVHVAAGAGRRRLSAVDDFGGAVGRADGHEAAAADAAGHRVVHTLAQRDGDRDVDGVPARLQEAQPWEDSQAPMKPSPGKTVRPACINTKQMPKDRQVLRKNTKASPHPQ